MLSHLATPATAAIGDLFDALVDAPQLDGLCRSRPARFVRMPLWRCQPRPRTMVCVGCVCRAGGLIDHITVLKLVLSAAGTPFRSPLTAVVTPIRTCKTWVTTWQLFPGDIGLMLGRNTLPVKSEMKVCFFRRSMTGPLTRDMCSACPISAPCIDRSSDSSALKSISLIGRAHQYHVARSNLRPNGQDGDPRNARWQK